MAEKKVRGRPFQKGHKFAKGGVRMSQEARDFRRASQEEIIIEYKYLWTQTEENLKAIVDDPETPGIRRWMAKVIKEGIHNSNLNALEIIFDRIYGKAKSTIDVNGGSLHFQLSKIFGEAEEKKKK